MHRRKLINNISLKQENIPLDKYKKEYFYLDLFSFVGCVINKEIIMSIGLPEKDYFI